MSKLELHSSARSLVGACALNALTSQGRCHKLIALSATLSALPFYLQAQELEVLETFTAIGEGETRASNAINIDDLSSMMPGLSLERSIDIIPGVNVTTTDPYGFYEFGTDIRLRAFRIEQIAVTVDGVPMGNNSPRYGTRATRVIDQENISEIKVNQGTGDLGNAAYEALGGSVEYKVRKPAMEQEILLKATVGDFDALRFFARYDTGEILPGLTAYISTSDFKFKTRGVAFDSKRRHTDVVLNYEMDGGSIGLQFGYNNRDDYDTNQAIRWDRWRALETGVAPMLANSTSVDSTAALFAANGYIEYDPFTFGLLGGGFQNGNYKDGARELGPPDYIVTVDNVGSSGLDTAPGEGINAIYVDKWRNGRQDLFTRLVFDFEPMESLTVSGNVYYQDKDNYGWWGVPKSVSESEVRLGYAADPTRTDITGAEMWYDSAGNPLTVTGSLASAPFASDHAIVVPGTMFDPAAVNGGYVDGIPGRTGRDEEFGGHRYGLYGAFDYEVSPILSLEGGMWYEFDRHQSNRPNYNFTDNGAITGTFEYDQVLFNNYYRDFGSTTTMFFIAAELSLMEDRLTIAGGAKSLSVDRNLFGQLNNAQWRNNEFTYRSVSFEDNFLPQIGFTFDLTDEIQIFSNYSENLSAPTAGTMTGGNFSEALMPETAKNIDLGMRFNNGSLSFSAAIFMISYDDRILSIPQAPGVSSFTAGDTEYQNVGGVESTGFEIGYDWKTPIEGLSLVGSFAYQDTTFKEDVFTGVVTTADPNGTYLYTVQNSVGALLQFARIEGKSLGNTPDFVFNTDVIYTIGEFTTRFGAKFYDEIFVNNLNTEAVDSYWIFNLNVSWRSKDLEGLTISVAAENLFDTDIWYASNYTNNFGGSVYSDQGRNMRATVEYKF